MALFGLFSKGNSSIRCARCNNVIKKDDIKGHQGAVYCSFCYNRILEESRTAKTQQRPRRTITIDTTHDYRQMPATIKEIKEAFDATDTKYSVNHFGDQWELVAGINGKANIFEIKFISKEAANSAVALRVFSLAHVENHQKSRILRTLNRLNDKYRFVRFTLDSDNDIKVEYDFPEKTQNIGAVALEMLLRTVSIVDSAYPELMRDLWS